MQCLRKKVLISSDKVLRENYVAKETFDRVSTVSCMGQEREKRGEEKRGEKILKKNLKKKEGQMDGHWCFSSYRTSGRSKEPD